jgi:predicted flap endonuclease-1-like 5' DNA nuclease
MVALADIEGVGKSYAAKLNKAGIRGVAGLLKAGATPEGRKQLVKVTGVSSAKILEWVNHADLYRISGIGSEYSDLLEAAGVDTVVELAKRKPESLLKTMSELNAKKKLVRVLPALSRITDWVKQAKSMPRVVKY